MTDKTTTRKNVRRLTRLYLRTKQNNYLKDGAYVTIKQGKSIINTMFNLL